MSRSDTEKYTDKPKRQADNQIEEGYKKRDIPNKEIDNRSWAPVNYENAERFKKAVSYKKTFGYRGL